ncbi:tRNA methyltransferase 10 homolog B isoform X3 [Labeo rohita]|uniref:tRNA methyltransferase 10 homolog B isoform X3 n=1 Tax=Labeo rohita TaxID=84645 RepID=UPI0021E2AF9B|nr:tRNA methyltransferase 10 homolog B isoform X3 [Labeo rohita]
MEDSCCAESTVSKVNEAADLLDFLGIDVELDPLCGREETAFSKNVMRKQRNWERRLEAKKSKRKEEKERKKLSRQNKGATEPQLSKRVIKAITKERLEEARGAGLRLCVDLSMTDCLSPKVRFTKQAQHYLRKSGRLIPDPTCLINRIDVTEESWFHLFPSEDVIYLTPDASEALEYVEEDKVYILGGLVDETIQKKISYTRAKELGIRTARLPIDEYMVKRPNPKNFHSKILAINQVFEILLTFRDTKDWIKALTAGIPPGKGYMVASAVSTDIINPPEEL